MLKDILSAHFAACRSIVKARRVFVLYFDGFIHTFWA